MGSFVTLVTAAISLGLWVAFLYWLQRRSRAAHPRRVILVMVVAGFLSLVPGWRGYDINPFWFVYGLLYGPAVMVIRSLLVGFHATSGALWGFVWAGADDRGDRMRTVRRAPILIVLCVAAMVLVGCSSTDGLVETLDRIAWKLEGAVERITVLIEGESSVGADLGEAEETSDPSVESKSPKVTVVVTGPKAATVTNVTTVRPSENPPVAIRPGPARIPQPGEMTVAQLAAASVRVDRDFSRVDQAVRALPATSSIDAAIEQLAAVASDDWDKVRAVYIWLTDNIAYDAEAFFSGGRSVTDPEGVFRTGKSVCQGYSELFRTLANGLGLNAALVSGYAKGYGYSEGRTFASTNHAWNAVLIDEAWHLFDATWGAGYVDGRRYVKDFGEFWFDPHPELFLRTHLPERRDWQLVRQPIGMNDFLSLPYAKSYVFENLCAIGYTDEAVLAALDSQSGLPEAYAYEEHAIHVVRAPLAAVLRAGEPVDVELRVPGAGEAAFINNRSFTRLERTGDTFHGSITPARGELKVSANIRHNNQQSFWCILSYRVE